MASTKKLPPTLNSPWRSVTDLRASLSRARELGGQHRRLLDQMNDRVAKRREELRATLDGIPHSQQEAIVNRSLGGFRAELKRASLEPRTLRLREMDALRQSVAHAKAHYQSPVQMLARDSLGSERRSRLMQQLEFSGDAELASLAALAVSSKDKELGAVLVQRVQRMPHASRPFSVNELADLIVGDEHRSIQSAIMEVEDLTQRALLDDRAFETGRGSAQGEIALALRARDRADLGAPEIVDTEET